MLFNVNLLPLAGSSSPPGTASTIIMIVIMIAIFYFLIIRPEGKKKKAAAELRNSLKVGDDVITIGGIIGTICAVKDNTLVIETGADRVRLEVTKWAISSKGSQPVQNIQQDAEANQQTAAADKKEKKSLFGKKKED